MRICEYLDMDEIYASQGRICRHLPPFQAILETHQARSPGELIGGDSGGRDMSSLIMSLAN